MEQHNSKHRKSEAQKQFEEDENAGRFAGNDTDAKAAREQAVQNIISDPNSSREEREGNSGRDAQDRPMVKGDSYNEEAQNVRDENVGNVDRLDSEEEVERARNKAGGNRRTDEQMNIEQMK